MRFSASSRVWRTGLVLCLAGLLAGCSIPRPESAVATAYDLGPQPEHVKSNPPIRGALLIPTVTSPAWLDESDIVYRLLYEDSTRPRAYAMSRWAADPASLVTDRIRGRFAAVSDGVVTPGYSAQSDYTLRIELEDFTQRFDAPGTSRGSLRARATLLDSRDRKLLAQQVFEIERPAEPNAAGAVKALSEATDSFVEQLVSWAVQTVRLARSTETAVTAKP